MTLFQKIDFISHAGLPLTWKIECDALTKDDWDGIARMIMDYETRPFGSVEGIPRGGIPLAEALKPYATEGPPMIVDDVKEMLLKLKKEGMSIILVEQNLQTALDVADRVYILDQGEIVFEGKSEELSKNKNLTLKFLGVST